MGDTGCERFVRLDGEGWKCKGMGAWDALYPRSVKTKQASIARILEVSANLVDIAGKARKSSHQSKPTISHASSWPPKSPQSILAIPISRPRRDEPELLRDLGEYNWLLKVEVELARTLHPAGTFG